jgi:hypothetical protein
MSDMLGTLWDSRQTHLLVQRCISKRQVSATECTMVCVQAAHALLAGQEGSLSLSVCGPFMERPHLACEEHTSSHCI